MSNTRNNVSSWLPTLIGPDTILVDGEEISVRRNSINLVGASQSDDPDNDKTDVTIAAVVGAAGSDNQVQYNNAGALGGASGLYINESTNRPVVPNGLEFAAGTSDVFRMVVDGTPTAARTVTIPDATTTLVGTNTTDTLTNKSIDAASNTISNIANANIAAGAAIAGTKISPDFGAQSIATTGHVQPGFIRNTPAGALDAYPTSGLIRMRYNEGVSTPVVMAKDASSNDQVIIGFGPFNATQFGNAAMNATFSGFATILAGAASIQVSANGASVMNCDGATGVSLGVPLQGSSATSVPFRLRRVAISKNDATDLTLTAAQYSCPYLEFSGTPGGAFNVITPSTGEGFYVVRNNTGQSLTIKRSGGTGVTIGAGVGGRTAVVYDNGTDIIRVTADA